MKVWSRGHCISDPLLVSVNTSCHYVLVFSLIGYPPHSITLVYFHLFCYCLIINVCMKLSILLLFQDRGPPSSAVLVQCVEADWGIRGQ
jgi:hypothetical protein